MPGDLPYVSVVLPIDDDRGELETCLAAWLGQSYPADRFELVMPSDGSSPPFERIARELVGARGRIVAVEDAVNERHLFDAGARTAQGPLLVLSEAHCVPNSEFLSEMTSYLRREGFAASECDSIPLARNALARFEARAFARGRVSPWANLVVHGFAIEKALYVQSGGLPYEFGNFAASAFAANLHAMGIRVGRCTTASVQHRYRDDLSGVRAFVCEEARGELACRETRPRSFSDYYFGGPIAEWEDRGRYATDLARQLLRVGLRRRMANVRPGRQRAASESARALARNVCAAIGGVRPWIWWTKARLCVLQALLPVETIPEGPRERLYDRFWRLAIHLGRLDYVAQSAHRAGPALSGTASSVGETDAGALAGFHLPEDRHGVPFRWSEPVAAMRLRPERGEHRVTLSYLTVRGEPELHLFWNGRRVPRLRVERTKDQVGVSFVVSTRRRSECFATLSFTCPPWLYDWRTTVERRALGIPVVEIRIEPVGAAVPDSRGPVKMPS